MAKKTKEKKKYLYIYLKQREVKGYRYDEGDDSPYSGFGHYERIVEKIGPAVIDTKDPDWGYERVEEVDPRIFENPDDYISVVYTSSYQGGTFGGTDGCICFEYAALDRETAKEWLEKNRERLEKYYSGWGRGLDDIVMEPIHLWK